MAKCCCVVAGVKRREEEEERENAGEGRVYANAGVGLLFPGVGFVCVMQMSGLIFPLFKIFK